MKNVLTPSDKGVLVSPLGLTTVASATDAAIQKNIYYRLGTAALIISNEEINDVMKIVKSLEESGLTYKGVSQTIQNEVKGIKRWIS